MKTVSVALVLCLNVGVDPPDIVKTQPCARLECWIGNWPSVYLHPSLPHLSRAALRNCEFEVRHVPCA